MTDAAYISFPHTANNSYYQSMAGSWVEQRNFGINYPLQALTGHPLLPRLLAEFEAMSPKIPSVQGWTPVKPNSAVTLAGWAQLTIDGQTGAVSSLVAKGKNYASSSKPLAWLRYQTLTDDDFANIFRSVYLRPGTGGENEYGKPNCTNATGAISVLSSASFVSAYLRPDQQALAVQVSFNSTLHTQYGAPAAAWLVFNTSASSSGIVDITLVVVNKTSTRYPEAMYLTFDPVGNTLNGTGQWVLDKLESKVSRRKEGYGGGGTKVCFPL